MCVHHCVIYMICGSNVIFISLHYSPFEFPVDIPMAVPSPKILFQAVKFVQVLDISSALFLFLCCLLHATTHLILSKFELCEYYFSFYVV